MKSKRSMLRALRLVLDMPDGARDMGTYISYVAVYGPVYWATYAAVYEAMGNAVRRGPRHPALSDFLSRARAEASWPWPCTWP